MNNTSLIQFKYNGARAMIVLHEQYLKSCLETWKEAKKLNISLPECDDKDYQSLETLLQHILRAARGYMVWICEQLDIPNPGIDKTPEPEAITEKADEYLSHLLEKWQLPLSEVPAVKFYSQSYKSRWGVEYCIDAMLEHAVMHPIRHEYQLKYLIRKDKK